MWEDRRRQAAQGIASNGAGGQPGGAAFEHLFIAPSNKFCSVVFSSTMSTGR